MSHLEFDADSAMTDLLPTPCFDHLKRMTDDRGVWGHARYASPRIEHGYCTDDNARALIVVCREPDPSPELVDLATVYLAFLKDAELKPAGFHNRRDKDGSWTDGIGPDDSQGRALWGLGTAASHGPTTTIRWEGLEHFERNASFESASPRANAFAILGAGQVNEAFPGHPLARQVILRGSERIRPGHDADWPWPEDRLAYDNARLPQALILAGVQLSDDRLLQEGLRLLEWLVGVETRGGHFSFTPVGGWAPGETRPGFDQQPVEAGAMADACATAWSVTGDPLWRDRLILSARWFLGVNDTGVALYEVATGGGRDGLTREGANQNQGAESTLAALSSLQKAALVH
jgi:hypothetical protein